MSERIDHCPVCGRPMLEGWVYRHIRLSHKEPVLDYEDESPITIDEQGYYNHGDFAWEQRESN